MTREQADKFCNSENLSIKINCISYIIRAFNVPPKICYVKLAEVMQAEEMPIQADTPEHLFESISEANEKHFISNIKYINKCISFD